MEFCFFIIALVYAMVGFGGGSSYIALLILFGVNFSDIPAVSLICNIIVVFFGSIHFVNQGYFKSRLVYPFVLTSIPSAYLGGMISVSKTLFLSLLSISLFFAGTRLLFASDKKKEQLNEMTFFQSIIIAPIIGSLLGFLSGIVGIGGGIFLAPILRLLKWGNSKEIAAATSLFILFNSVSGLIGQFSKLEGTNFLSLYWPCFISVLLGGNIGSFLGSQRLSARAIQSGTAILILYVSIKVGAGVWAR